ncbi:MAG: iron(II)-dependent oxidoreductase [Myxococcota bacterium]
MVGAPPDLIMAAANFMAAANSEPLIQHLRQARDGQLFAFSGLTGDQLMGVQAHGHEPPLWEMGHVIWFQEVWLLRHLLGAEPRLPNGDSMFDAFNISYQLRWSHELPDRAATLVLGEEVLAAALAALGPEATADQAYFYSLAAHHETMHTENLMAMRQTLGYAAPGQRADAQLPAPELGYEPHDVAVPGGTLAMGADRNTPGFVCDNEMWAHPVEVAPFRIASTLVTNAAYQAFVDAGGYSTRSLWCKRGWQWRRKEDATQPLMWRFEDGRWLERRFDTYEPLRLWHPMCFVNLFEARAYARFAGRRLPTEAEWEFVASMDPSRGTKRRYPWGDEPPTANRAHLDLRAGSTVDVRALPAGDSAFGCRQLLGNVWEWTDTRFEPYPGFEPGPYTEYSAPYFGKKPVLRGGAWTTSAQLATSTYRNFFIRHRRNIFAGIRTCAVG